MFCKLSRHPKESAVSPTSAVSHDYTETCVAIVLPLLGVYNWFQVLYSPKTGTESTAAHLFS